MKEIVLNTVYKTKNYKKFMALVDDEDFERVSKYNWWITCNYRYAKRNENGKSILLHTFITGFKITDHKDGNGLNCQRSNMRDVTRKQNNRNKSKQKGICSSIYKGVYKCQPDKKWRATICGVYLGLFLSEVNAAQAYNFGAEKLFGEFANLNKS